MPSFFLLLLPLISHASVNWQALLNESNGQRVHFGAALEGNSPFRLNESEDFAPASAAKLFTAGAALAELGPDFRYSTNLHWIETAPGVAAELTIVGSGDPSWGMSELHEGLRDRLDSYAAALKTAGITSLQGEPLAAVTDPRWNSIAIPEGWKDSDPLSCDGALAQGFNLNLNCATLSVTSPTRFTWQSSGLNSPVSLSIRSGKTTDLNVKLVQRRAGPVFAVEGTWKSGTSPQSFTLPVYDTRAWAQALFRQAILAQGIKINSALRRPIGAVKQLEFRSEPLSELLKPFLKNSVNVMGDAFLKTLGARNASASDASLLTPGLARLYVFLRPNGDERDFALHDGSGLSRTSHVTAAFLLRYLTWLENENYFRELYAALPIAGIDGTLSNRMKGTAAEGVLRAKTGTLDGVYNLAGYVPAGKSFVPFVLLTKTSADLSATARAAEDRVGARLAELHRNPEEPRDGVEPYPYIPEHASQDAQ